jgi:hypothetical protein
MHAKRSRVALAVGLAALLVLPLVLAPRAKGYVYWAQPGTGAAGDPLAPVSSIGRAELDGSGVDKSFISNLPSPAGVAVEASHVYWARGSIYPRPGLSGANPHGSTPSAPAN